MSYLLPHLHTGFSVDQAILSVSRELGGQSTRHPPRDKRSLDSGPLQEEDRVVVMRFGHDFDQQCMQMDEVKLIMTSVIMILSSALLECQGLNNDVHCHVTFLGMCRFWQEQLIRSKTLPSFTLLISRKCLTSTPCTSCMTPVQLCSSSGTRYASSQGPLSSCQLRCFVYSQATPPKPLCSIPVTKGNMVCSSALASTRVAAHAPNFARWWTSVVL